MFPITKDCVQKKTFRISGRFGKAFHRLHAHTVDQFLHPFRAGFTHFVNNVAVFIQRESCGIVPHVLLQGLDIITSFNAVYSECMAKIVDPVMLQAGLLQNLLEFLPDGRLNVICCFFVTGSLETVILASDVAAFLLRMQLSPLTRLVAIGS